MYKLVKHIFCTYKNVNRILSKNKERLRKEDCERCQNLTEEEKDKGQYRRERYKTFSEDGKQNMAKYKINYYITHKK